MFRDAKVGDRVWSVCSGWTVIDKIDNCCYYSIHTEEGAAYDYSGYYHKYDKLPSLFWDEVKIVPPPKPKRKAKKVLEFDIYLYTDFTGRAYLGIRENSGVFGRKQEYPANIKLGEDIHIRHEFEGEE